MQMTFRWFGEDLDTVSLKEIRQIPGVAGIVPALHDLPVGEVWPLECILKMKKTIENAGFTMKCIESVNVHEDIKLGNENAKNYIENYIQTIRYLAKAGVEVICYNFMPVFDWTRTDLSMRLSDGSNALAYDGRQIEGKDPEAMFREIDEHSHGYAMPGWEPERIADIKALFKKYKKITEADLRQNLITFLKAIIPVCEELNVRMAIHPDDPPWSIFGLPRIIKNTSDYEWLLNAIDSPVNGLAFCTGSLGASLENDLPKMIRQFGDRIYFAHLRNICVRESWFNETAHLSSEGTLDMYEIIKALQESGFDGYIRPDHGRMIWGEVARPGYGLYDRALGASYILGLWEAVQKCREEKQC